jgi:hypothetical protein
MDPPVSPAGLRSWQGNPRKDSIAGLCIWTSVALVRVGRRNKLPAISGLPIRRKISRATWRRIDDLVANGFVQQLQRRRWRGSVFVGVPPETLIIHRGSGSFSVSRGCFPQALDCLSRSVIASGGSCELIASSDLEVVGAMKIKVTNRGAVSKLAAEYGFAKVSPASLQILCCPIGQPCWRIWLRLLLTALLS